jgi:hypothetical protein
MEWGGRGLCGLWLRLSRFAWAMLFRVH